MALSENPAAGASMDDNLATNLLYGLAVCRVIYYRRPEPLSEARGMEGQEKFWKQFLNTPQVLERRLYMLLNSSKYSPGHANHELALYQSERR